MPTTAPPDDDRDGEHSDRSDDGASGEAEERQAPHVGVVHEAIRKEGEEELGRAPAALAWSGLAAGLSMGFSFLAPAYLYALAPEADWRMGFAKLAYPVGFLIVILGRQQLFTENTLTPVIPLLHDWRGKLGGVARLWAIVFATNLVGTAAFAWALAFAPHLDPGTSDALLEVGRAAYKGDWGASFTSAVFAGWLVAVMVWLLPYAGPARVAVVVIVTYLIGLGHLDHCVAGSVEVLYLVARGEVALGAYLVDFLLPAVVGNVLGGVVLVAALNHAQVVADK